MNQLFGLLMMYLTASVGPTGEGPSEQVETPQNRTAQASESLAINSTATESSTVPLTIGDNPISLARSTPQRLTLEAVESGLYQVQTTQLPEGIDTVLGYLDPVTNEVLDEDDDGGEGYASLLTVQLAAGESALFQVSELSGHAGEFIVQVSRNTIDMLQLGDNPIDLPAGTPLFLEFQPTDAGFYQIETTELGELDTVLGLLDPNTGALLQENDDGGEGYASLLSINAAADERYLLRVSELSEQAGSFIIRVSQTSTSSLQLGTNAISLEAGSPQLLELQLTEPGFYQLETVDLPEGVDTVLARLDPVSGEVLEENDDGGQGYASRLSLWVTAAQPYLFRVSELNGAAGQFALQVSQPTIEVFGPGNHRVELGDGGARFFELALPEAGIYQLTTVGSPVGVDPVLRRHDATTGELLQEDDDSGEGYAPSLHIDASTLSNSLFEVVDYNNNPAAIKVSVRDLGEPVVLQAGQSVADQAIGAGASRWYRLDPATDQPLQRYSFSTHTLSESLDTTIELLDGNFQSLGFDDDSGEEALSSRLMSSTVGEGGLFLRVQNIATAAGSYSLSVEVPEVEALPVGVSGDHFLAVDGRILYRLSSSAGQYHSISTGNLANGVDTVLRILDTSGTTVLAEDDDGGEDLASRLEWTADAAGDYWVEIANIASSAGTFELRVASSP